jgi:hypothetical protein
MKILDLNCLSIEETNKLTEISSNIIEEFNKLTEKIVKSTDGGLASLLNPTVGRNPYQSDLFANIAILLLVKSIVATDRDLIMIIPQNKVQNKILSNHIRELKKDIIIKRVRETNIFTNNLSILKILSKSFKLISTKRKRRRNNLKRGRFILLDTFILQDSINSNKYIDRYYPGIMNAFYDNNLCNLLWVPTILGNYTSRQLSLIQKKSTEKIIFKQDYLLIIDYMSSIYQMLKSSLKRKSIYCINGLDISLLIYTEYRTKRFYDSSFEGLLNYAFIKRLKSNQIDLDLFIDWNENQPIDKGMIKGVRDFYKDVYIKGYQGYIISTDFCFYIQPTDIEISSGVIPDEICVVGKALEDRIRKFTMNVTVSTAPAFRFQDVYKRYSSPSTIIRKIVLVALPIGIDESSNIVKLLLNSIRGIDKKDFDIYLKPHPALNLNDVKTKIGEAWKSSFKITMGNFNEIAAIAHVVIGSASTTLIETITRGIPVIVVASNTGINQNPIPKDISDKLWRLCSTKDEVLSALISFTSITIKQKRVLERIGEDVKTNYFEPISDLGIQNLLSKKKK